MTAPVSPDPRDPCRAPGRRVLPIVRELEAEQVAAGELELVR